MTNNISKTQDAVPVYPTSLVQEKEPRLTPLMKKVIVVTAGLLTVMTTVAAIGLYKPKPNPVDVFQPVKLTAQPDPNIQLAQDVTYYACLTVAAIPVLTFTIGTVLNTRDLMKRHAISRESMLSS